MDLNQMECFKVIAETGSLTRAAEILHVSQPAMSALLRRLEGELGTELFDRSPNRVKLNAAGELALRHTNAILRNVEAMRTELEAFTRKNRTLNAAFCDPGVQWYSIPRFSMSCPEVTLNGRLYEENAVKLLLDRECDLVVAPAEVRHPRVENIPFLADQVFLTVPPGSELTERKSVSLREIPAQPLLLPTIGGHFLRTIEKIIAEERPDITVVKNDFLIVQHMIRSTNFLATISTLSIELRNDGLRLFIPLTDQELNIVYQIAFLRGNREKVQQFLSWAKSVRQPGGTVPRTVSPGTG